MSFKNPLPGYHDAFGLEIDKGRNVMLSRVVCVPWGTETGCHFQRCTTIVPGRLR